MSVIQSITNLRKFYRHDLTDDQLKEYVRTLTPFGAEKVEQAAQVARKTINWFPKLPELLRLLGVSPAHFGEMAFDMLCQTLALGLDGGDAVWFSDPNLQAAIRTCGGWKLCAQKYQKDRDSFFVWFKKQFIEQYERHMLGNGNTLISFDFQPIGNMERPLNKKRISCSWSPSYQEQTRITHAPRQSTATERLIGGVIEESEGTPV